MEPYPGTRHVITHFKIDVVGDDASCASYATGYHFSDAPLGIGHAFYRDTLVRTSAGWRIAVRRRETEFLEGESHIITLPPRP